MTFIYPPLALQSALISHSCQQWPWLDFPLFNGLALHFLTLANKTMFFAQVKA